ncbi:DUF3515 family protein [Microbacterium kyungheense]|uniref:Uncharacterized protein DUF3515 n=1 Tax=Microbacterium kyungheense TaxID=1263636 RepID=A0A543F2D3_9MICO|nr:DUF3515 family protein [Microbacterium kyungheense]TQM28014.1 uncharacterized protein DUF3515 [Microbacterium kyungheense]
MIPTLLAAGLAAVAAIGLAGCSATVDMDPAKGADDAACAEVSVRLPDTVDGQSRIWTDAQATGAWGNDGSAILLRCGVTPPGPTEAKCITLGGVDWIVDETQAPKYLVTTYGREPAVEVFIDNETVSPNEVLTQLGERVVQNATSSDSACTNTETLLDDATAG